MSYVRATHSPGASWAKTAAALFASASLASLRLNGMNPRPVGLVQEMVWIKKPEETTLDKISSLDVEQLIRENLEAEFVRQTRPRG